MIAPHRELQDRLRDLYSAFRESDKLVTPSINSDTATKEEIDAMNTSYDIYYEAVDEMRATLGKILDDLDKGYFDQD